METTKTQVTAVPHVVDEWCHACRKCLARTVCKSKAIIGAEYYRIMPLVEEAGAVYRS